MRVLKKIILISLISVFIIASMGTLMLKFMANQGVPDYNESLRLSHMTSEVQVLRDRWAVPHFYAENEKDLYRAVGYVMAQDRLWQMDLLRRLTEGKLSELFGEVAIDNDTLMRSLRISEKSRSLLAKTEPEIMEALLAFADGINQYIENNYDRLPVEFTILGYKPEKWEPMHSYNLVGYMAWDLNSAWNTEVLVHRLKEKFGIDLTLSLLPKTESHPVIHPERRLTFQGPLPSSSLMESASLIKKLGLGVFSGSNSWAVSTKKSKEHGPILANDMHLGLSSPGIWYQMRMKVKDGLDVTGVALPGAPNIICGHNQDIAWGMTNVMVDGMDFYVEKINPDNENQYLLDGTWQDLKLVREEIWVKGQDEPVVRIIKYTHRGPIVSDLKGMEEAVSTRWTGNEDSNELKGTYLLNRARDFNDFREATSLFRSIHQNINYADKKGNIGLQTSAGIPDRNMKTGFFFLDGTKSENDWAGLVPFEELPYTYNPASGQISSANNRTAGPDFPHYVSLWFAPPHRINRIRELLNQKEKLGIQDMIRMQSDQTSLLALSMLDQIRAALSNASGLNPEEKKAVQYLALWDGVMDKESQAAAIFESLTISLVTNIFSDELGEELFDSFLGNGTLAGAALNNVFSGMSPYWADDIHTPSVQEDLNSIIVRSLKDGLNRLEGLLDNNIENWQWQRIHGLKLSHPLGSVKILDVLFGLNLGPIPTGGGSSTVSPYSYSMKKPFDSSFGSSQRHIYIPSDWDSSLVVIPTGNSGIPGSIHYLDQTLDFLANRYHPDYFTWELVKENARYQMIISGIDDETTSGTTSGTDNHGNEKKEEKKGH